MKKLMIAMASILTIFLIAGCGNGDSSNSTGKKSDKIVFAYWGDESENRAIKEAVSAFSEEYPEIEVETQWIQKDYLTKVQVQIAGNTAADVYLISGGDLPGFANSFAEQTLNEEIYLNESVIEPMKFEDVVKAKPFVIKSKVMAINKDLFKKNNIELPDKAEGMTTEEFESVVEQLTDDQASPTVYGMEPAWFDPWIYTFGGMQYRNNNTESNMDAPEVIEAADYVVGLKDKKVHPASEEAEGQSMIEWFLSGRIGVFTNFGPWNLPQMRDVKGFEWDLVPFVGNGGSKEVNGLAVSKESKQAENAQIFVDFMTDNPKAQTIIGANENAYGVPVLSEVVDSFTTIYEDKNLQAFVDGAYNQTPQETQKNTNEILSVKNTALQSTTLKDGDKTPAEVFPGLAKDITKIIQGN